MSGSWLENPATWDTLTIGGVPVPGVCKVKAVRKYKVDKKNSAGADGATLTGLGHEPCDVTITVKLWTRAQWEQLKTLAPLILPQPGKSLPVSLDVSHPALSFLKVRSLYFTEIGSPEETSRHVYEVELKATEYLPVKAGKSAIKTLGASATIDSVAVEDGLIEEPAPATADGTFGQGAGVLAPVDDPSVTGP